MTDWRRRSEVSQRRRRRQQRRPVEPITGASLRRWRHPVDRNELISRHLITIIVSSRNSSRCNLPVCAFSRLYGDYLGSSSFRSTIGRKSEWNRICAELEENRLFGRIKFVFNYYNNVNIIIGWFDKSYPLLYQNIDNSHKIVLKLSIKFDFFVKLMYQRSLTILSVDIKYSMRDLIWWCELLNWPAAQQYRS